MGLKIKHDHDGSFPGFVFLIGSAFDAFRQETADEADEDAGGFAGACKD
jgi:hypothetical protein